MSSSTPDSFLKSSLTLAFVPPENRRKGVEKKGIGTALPRTTICCSESLVLWITHFCSRLFHMQRSKHWRKISILLSAITPDISNASTMAFLRSVRFKAGYASFPTHWDLIGGERVFGKTSYSEALGTYEISMAIIPSIMSEPKEGYSPMIFVDFARTSFLFFIWLWGFLKFSWNNELQTILSCWKGSLSVPDTQQCLKAVLTSLLGTKGHCKKKLRKQNLRVARIKCRSSLASFEFFFLCIEQRG